MKKYLLLLLTLLPMVCFSQVVGEWKITQPEYKWDSIHLFYTNDRVDYEIDNPLEDYIIKESFEIFVDIVLIKFQNDHIIKVATIGNTYQGIWEQYGNVLDVVVIVNNTRAYFDIVIESDTSLVVSSTNKEYLGIEEKYLKGKIKLEKIL